MLENAAESHLSDTRFITQIPLIFFGKNQIDVAVNK